ncbi:MAG: ankyrin repeat domain-containing protein [Armatimonadetes bacterium]|nr:ankyrin repeat domain-containing protein [Armatimonadota bacterium]
MRLFGAWVVVCFGVALFVGGCAPKPTKQATKQFFVAVTAGDVAKARTLMQKYNRRALANARYEGSWHPQCLVLASGVVMDFTRSSEVRAYFAVPEQNGDEPRELRGPSQRESRILCFDFRSTVMDALDTKGSPPLIMALQGGHRELTRALIDAGADINMTNGKGVTPLHVALLGGQDAIVTLLLQRGADVNKEAGGGVTPLHIATALGKKEITASLISAGAQVDAGDNHGNTALHRAASNTVALLVAEFAAVDARNALQQTPMHLAAQNGDASAVEKLLDAGAAVNARDKLMRTPLHYAALANSVDTAQALLKGGADVHLRDSKGLSPLGYAASRLGTEPPVEETRWSGLTNPVRLPDGSVFVGLYKAKVDPWQAMVDLLSEHK